MIIGRCAEKTVLMRQSILTRFVAGEYKPGETLMIITPTGQTTKTVLEWLLEWFPALGALLL